MSSEPEIPEEGTRAHDIYIAETVKLHRMTEYEPRTADLPERVVFVSYCENCSFRMDRDETPGQPVTTLGYAYQMRCPAKYTPGNPPREPEVWY